MLETISSSGQTIRARKITSWLKYLQRVSRVGCTFFQET